MEFRGITIFGFGIVFAVREGEFFFEIHFPSKSKKQEERAFFELTGKLY